VNQTHPIARLIDARWAARLVGIALVAQLGFLAIPRFRASLGMAGAILGVSAVGAVWMVRLFMGAAARRAPLEVEWRPRAAHGFQTVAQAVVYGYWAYSYAPAREQLLYVLAQVPFAYLLDMGLGWRRYGRFRLGFGPLPVVGSINLFLWMVDAFFAVQMGMIALAYLSREFIQWTRDGTRRHIFNPSAFALTAVALGLLVLNRTDLARGQEIAGSLGIGLHCYDAILVGGLVVQIMFPVVLTTLAAFVSVLGLGAIYGALTGGVYFVDTAVPVAVFLGMTLLITDPATSPTNPLGKLIYGALYGAGVFALYTALGVYGGAPWGAEVTYFDKLLAVPVLNLLVPLMQRIGAVGWARARRGGRGFAVALYGLLFVIGRPYLVDNPGRDVGLWNSACAQNEANCHGLAVAYQARCLSPGRDESTCSAAEPKVLESGCAAGVLPICGHLGARLVSGAPGFTRDAGRGAALLDRSCRGGNLPACVGLGTHLLETGDQGDQRPEVGLARACALDNVAACELLGLLVSRYAETAADHARAVHALERGCTPAQPVACAQLAHRLLEGRGVAKDAQRARHLLGVACAGGMEPACRMMKATGAP
jgi:hypothetical protein